MDQQAEIPNDLTDPTFPPAVLESTSSSSGVSIFAGTNTSIFSPPTDYRATGSSETWPPPTEPRHDGYFRATPFGGNQLLHPFATTTFPPPETQHPWPGSSPGAYQWAAGAPPPNLPTTPRPDHPMRYTHSPPHPAQPTSRPVGATPDVPGTSPEWTSSAVGQASLLATTSYAAGPSARSPETPRKKRGRPRLYRDEDDETEQQRVYSSGGRAQTFGRTDGEFNPAAPWSPQVPQTPQASYPSSRSAGSPILTSPIRSGLAGRTPSLVGYATRAPAPVRDRDGDGDGDAGGGDVDDEDGEDEDGRQAIIRARNKAAATRYRAKTIAAVADMEAKEREVSMLNQALIACAGHLRDEVFHLKSQLLDHAECGCPAIRDYLTSGSIASFDEPQNSQTSPPQVGDWGVEGVPLLDGTFARQDHPQGEPFGGYFQLGPL